VEFALDEGLQPAFALVKWFKRSDPGSNEAEVARDAQTLFGELRSSQVLGGGRRWRGNVPSNAAP
jgi:hypothetical protein